MAAAVKTLLGVVQWRWTPFFGLVGGTLLYVLLAVLIVPTKIGGDKKAKSADELSVVTDESPPLTGTIGRAPPRGTAPRGFAPPPPPSPPSPVAPAVVPTAPPMERTDPVPPPAREVPPEPPPPPPPPPAQAEEPEEEEQGALPGRSTTKTLAGALRMLPPPAVRGAAPNAPEPEPEPDEPDDEAEE